MPTSASSSSQGVDVFILPKCDEMVFICIYRVSLSVIKYQYQQQLFSTIISAITSYVIMPPNETSLAYAISLHVEAFSKVFNAFDENGLVT